MTIALVSTGTAALTTRPAFGQATASGNLLVCWLYTNNSNATFNDSIVGTGWTLVGSGGQSFNWASLWYKKNSSAGETAPTVTTGGSVYYALLREYSGADTSSPLDSSGGNGGTGGSTQPATNAASDAAGGDLIVFAVGWNGGNNGTVTNTMADSAGNTVTPTAATGNNGAGVNYDFAWGVAGATTGASKDTATGTLNVFDNGAGCIASFKAAAGAPAAPPAATPARPGQTWLRRFRHRQQPPAAVIPAAGAPAAAAGAGSVTAVATQIATGAAAGAGSVTASAAPPCITGIGGTGAGYFQDQFGKPRMVLGDAAWALPGNAGRWNSGNWQADYDTYLANRAGQGFTVIYTKPIGTTQSGNIDDNGATFDSLYPFQGGSPSTGTAGANPSSGLTASFWARIDYFLASALAKGITVFLNAIGYDSDFSSGPGPLFGKSTTEFTAYGTALGTRYAAQPNLVWHLADDYFGENDALITAFMSGVRGAGDTHLVSIENFPETTSRQDISNSSATTWGAANAQYNFCYSYNVTYYSVEKAYLESSPIPVIWGDGYFYQGSSSYAGGSGAFAFDRAVRQDAWHAISSGARGWINGAEDIWQWPSTALAKSATDWWYANNAGVIRAFMESLTGWQTLIPDTSSALVTAGRGTHASTFSSGGGGGQYEVAFTDSYVTASRGPDSGSGASLAVIYLSHGTTITIDQTKMVSGYTATWVDPLTAATSAATAGSTYNSSAKGNNSQGDPDWVLVLQAPTGSTGTASAAGAGSVTAVATAIAPAAAAGAGAVTDVATEIAGAAPAGAGAVTAAATQVAPASAAGAGTVSGVATQAATAAAAGAGSAGPAPVIQIAPAAAAGAGAVADAVTQIATALAAGTGSVTAAGASSGAVTAAAAGAGAVTADVIQIAPAAAAGAGSVSDVATQIAKATAAGAGAVTAAGQITGTASAAGAGAATAKTVQAVIATAAGAGLAVASGGQPGGSRNAAFLVFFP